MKRKHPKPINNFQPKIFAIWAMLIVILLLAWSVINPTQNGRHRLEWSINDVLDSAKHDRIISGHIQALPNRGIQWYRVAGRAYEPSMGNDPIEFSAQGRLTDGRFNELVATTNLVEKPGSTLLNDLILGIVPFIVILGLLYFLFARQVRSAGKGAMAFGKSRARLLSPDRKKVTFQDVAGCEEAKEEVAEIVDFLKNPKKFSDIGGRIPKGCLLVGAPGTGKTLLAKAVAGEADVPFFTISGSDFVEMFVGVGAARVRDLFEQGRKHAPCIIFIDEIDAVGRQRGAGLGGGNDEREQTLNSILVEMDGFDGRDGVIIIAATNRPDVLDSALLRPGRFDRQVVIDLPDLRGRREILAVHAKKIKMTDDVNLDVLAKNTPGFSGADLENLLNEGALLAARKGKKEAERFDFEEAREKVSYGRERKRLMDDDDRKITAFHEAGHAIVQAVIDDGLLPVHKVTIIPRGQSLGSTMFMPSKDILNQSKSHLLNQICCAMAGRQSEAIFLEDISSGAAADIKAATKIARKMVCDLGMSNLGPLAFGDNQDHIFLGREITRSQNYSEKTAQLIDAEVHTYIQDGVERARKILQENRKAVELVAQALIEHETLDGTHIYEALEHGKFISPICYGPMAERPSAQMDPAAEVAEKNAVAESVPGKAETKAKGRGKNEKK